MEKDLHRHLLQDYEWSIDEKAKGKDKRRIHKTARIRLKRRLKQEVADIPKEKALELEEFKAEDIEEAIYCHEYGPCDRCKCAQDITE